MASHALWFGLILKDHKRTAKVIMSLRDQERVRK
jgi:hypothetical protein